MSVVIKGQFQRQMTYQMTHLNDVLSLEGEGYSNFGILGYFTGLIYVTIRLELLRG